MASRKDIVARPGGDAEMTDATVLDTTPNLAHEEAILTQQLRTLEDFVKTNLPDSLPPLPERCRVLREKIKSSKELIARSGKKSEGETFDRWLKSGIINFSSASASAIGPALQSYRKTIPISRSISASENPSEISEPVSGNLISAQNQIKPGKSENSTTDLRERNPCLRCKILKRKCNSNERCSLCPVQSNDNEHDYWKVLGCFRDPLKGLCEFLLPGHLFFTTRYSSVLNTSFNSMEITFKPSRQFRDVNEEVLRSFPAYMCRLPYALGLYEEGWGKFATCETTSDLAPGAAHQDSGGLDIDKTITEERLKTWHSKLSLSRVVATASEYKCETGYNPYNLLRLGEKFYCSNKIEWEIFDQAQALIPKIVDLYLAEKQICECLLLAPNEDAAPIILESVDIRDDFKSFLDNMESLCANRGKLTGQKQLACLYSILLLSIIKSLLVDLSSFDDQQRRCSESRRARVKFDSVRIQSAYKALVSVFCWSSKSDLLCEDFDRSDVSFSQSVEDTRSMLRTSDWHSWGVKGSKEFLLPLSSNLLPDRTFNGFFIQRFNLAKLEKMTYNTLLDITDASGEINPWLAIKAPATTPSYPSAYLSDTFTSTSPSWKATQSWENMTLVNGGLKVMSSTSSLGRSRSGIRKGRLSPATAEKARAMRRLKSCWNCWGQKIPCSDGDVCVACQRRKDTSLLMTRCIRTGFKEYNSLFSPALLFLPLKKTSIEIFITENVVWFLDHADEAKINYGSTCTMTMKVNVFEPKSLLESSQEIDEQRGIRSIPVGLLMMDIQEPKNETSKYLDGVLDQLITSVTPLNNSINITVTDQTMNNLLRFYRDGTSDLIAILKECLLVHTILACMQHLPEIAYLDLSPPPSPTSSHQLSEPSTPAKTTSRLLDLQLKHLMSKILQETIPKILEPLEKNIRLRTRSSWFISFPVILALCVCIEELQIAAITGTTPQFFSQQPPNSAGIAEVCKLLEETVFGDITDIFHLVYRTHRDGNPLRDYILDGFVKEAGYEKHEVQVDLIRGFAEMIVNSYDELTDLNQPLVISPIGDIATVRKRNSGRLVAKFLMSLVDEKVVAKRKSNYWHHLLS